MFYHLGQVAMKLSIEKLLTIRLSILRIIILKKLHHFHERLVLPYVVLVLQISLVSTELGLDKAN